MSVLFNRNFIDTIFEFDKCVVDFWCQEWEFHQYLQSRFGICSLKSIDCIVLQCILVNIRISLRSTLYV